MTEKDRDNPFPLWPATQAGADPMTRPRPRPCPSSSREQTVSKVEAMHSRSEAAVTAAGKINNRLRVLVTAGPQGITAEWHPAMPARLNEREMARYRRVRHEALDKLGKRLGGAVAVLEV